MKRNYEVEEWNHRRHPTEGTDRFDAVGAPLILTPHKNLIHITGDLRLEHGWDGDDELMINGADLGGKLVEWDGGGIGWEVTESLIDEWTGRKEENPFDERQFIKTEFPRAERSRADYVVFCEVELLDALPPYNGYTCSFKDEPEEQLLRNLVIPRNNEEAVDQLRALFEEQGIFNNNHFFFKTKYWKAVNKPDLRDVYYTNEKRWRAYKPAYKKALAWCSKECERTYLVQKAAREDAERKMKEQKAREEAERQASLSEAQREHEAEGRRRRDAAIARQDAEIKRTQDEWAAWTDKQRRDWMSEHGYTKEQQERVLADWHSRND